MPVLGADALLPIGAVPEGQAEKQILVCEIKGLKATGHLIPTGFVVLKGSQAVLKGACVCTTVPVYSRVAEKIDRRWNIGRRR